MIVWTNGCFDILHRGHIELFKYAKSLVDYLVVGVDTDDRVRASKGAPRPINNLEDRIEMLESIRYIDEVVVFDSRQGLEDEIRQLAPDVMVIGSDWKEKEVIGQQYCTELKFFDRIGEYSTTRLSRYVNH